MDEVESFVCGMITVIAIMLIAVAIQSCSGPYSVVEEDSRLHLYSENVGSFGRVAIIRDNTLGVACYSYSSKLSCVVLDDREYEMISLTDR